MCHVPTQRLRRFVTEALRLGYILIPQETSNPYHSSRHWQHSPHQIEHSPHPDQILRLLTLRCLQSGGRPFLDLFRRVARRIHFLHFCEQAAIHIPHGRHRVWYDRHGEHRCCPE